MDLKKLRYFKAIIQAGSFTKAARQLNVAQSALSLHMKRLEEAFGKDLLIRGTKGIFPTEAGALIYERADRILADVEKAWQDVRDFGEKPKGTVRIGLPGTISSVLSEPLIAACQEKYPDIKLVIADAMSGFVKDWLAEGQVDLAVLYLDIQTDVISSSLMLEEEIVAVHPYSQKGADTISSEDLAADPLILPSRSHGLRVMLEGEVPVIGGRIVPTIEVDSFNTIKKLVEKGYGCSLLPLYAVHQEVKDNRLTVTRLKDRQLWRRLYLARGISIPSTSASREVMALLVEQITALVRTGHWAGARLSSRKGTI